MIKFNHDELRRARLQHGLTQVQLAEKLGISPFHVSRIETGRSIPRPNLIGKIVEELDIDPSVLIAPAGDNG